MYSSIEQRRAYFRKRYNLRKSAIYQKLGFRCKVCRSPFDLQLDHVDPKTKTYEFSYLFMLSPDNPKVLEELKKLQLLCRKCHKEKTSSENKTKFCKRGHPRVPENLSGRACKICMREFSRRYKKRKKLG